MVAPPLLCRNDLEFNTDAEGYVRPFEEWDFADLTLTANVASLLARAVP